MGTGAYQGIQRVAGIEERDAGMKVFLFVEKDCAECEKAEELLRSRGIPYKKVNIDENGVRGWMIMEFGSSKTPLLTTPTAVVAGLEGIEKYLKTLDKNEASPSLV